MGHLGSDGKPFDADKIKRLERALISLTDQVMQAVPGNLSVELLKKWRRVLAAELERMRPGKCRRQDITSLPRLSGVSPAQGLISALLPGNRRLADPTHPPDDVS